MIVTAVYAASLERTLTLKREAGYGLDAVSAEDIARLPAANAAEAMQRACLTLADCFGQVAAWSHAHPDHELIVIFVNTKEEPFNNPAIPNPPLYTEADLAGIDADAAKAFGRDHIVAPDDLRGGSPTLRQAATGGRWPFVLW